MVGVPKSNGCATCRKRKIKCDESRPSCLRCIDNRFSCPGYPIRLKFQDEGINLRRKLENTRLQMDERNKPHYASRIVLASHSSAAGCQPSLHRGSFLRVDVAGHCAEQDLAEKIPIYILSLSPIDKLANRFCETFRSDLPAGKSMAVFGTFITEVPCHVGLNPACDLAIQAICLAHGALLTASGRDLVQSRMQYTQALIELQQCINDKDQATSLETLCATMLLGIYELLACTDEKASIQHVGGAARLIEMNGPSQFNEPFAHQMLNALKGMIVIEAILCKRPCFLDSPSWKQVSENIGEDGQQPFDTLFSLLPRLPNILSSLRDLLAAPNPSIRAINCVYHRALSLRRDLRLWRFLPAYIPLFHTTSHPCVSPTANPLPFPSTLTYTSNQAAALLCTHAAMLILLNLAIKQLSSPWLPGLRYENQLLAEQICASYAYSTTYSPFGNSYMGFGLRVARLVLAEGDIREWVAGRLREGVGLGLGSGGREGKLRGDGREGELDTCFDYLKIE